MLKKSLFQNRKNIQSKGSILALFLFNFLVCHSQIGNYVNNGSFETHTDCTNQNIINAPNWDEIEQNYGWCKYNHLCIGSVPNNGFGFQYAHSGDAYVTADFFCLTCAFISRRTYARNTLKTTLKQNVTYCVKFYVNIGNYSRFGIDGFGAYFGDSSLDTITLGHKILNYLTPQIQNPNGNIITDTLSWTAITGTFTASGNEKYMVIGNFKTDAATNTIAIQTPTFVGNQGCIVSLDDVSCIPIDLPAFAGEDKHIIPGETLYIGRQRDVGIDEDCMWYKLPVSITPTTPAIDTAAGIFVNPVVTTTYVVKQDICGVIKYDTVVVFKDGVGFEKLEMLNDGLKIYPQPASEQITLSVENEKMYEGIKHLELYNNLGQLIREEEISFKDRKFNLAVSELTVGVYTIKLVGIEAEVIYKRVIINR